MAYQKTGDPSLDELTQRRATVELEIRRRELLREIQKRNETRVVEYPPQYYDFKEFAKYATDGFWDAEKHKHLDLIGDKLTGIEDGSIKRLMIFCPPRHAKSLSVSHLFPAWYLGRNPDNRVILTSYEADFAESWGRKARDLLTVTGPGIFNVQVARTPSAARNWGIAYHRGGMNTAGVGGSITGRGAHVGIIDDPIKNSEEARSDTLKEHMVDWFKTTFLTRMEADPPGALIIILCMTGDTPVLMADGTERPLSEVKVGDKVATYDKGKLNISTVRNHRSNGLDSVYEIKTTNGKIVRANERHPFLVSGNGQFNWIQLKNLTKDHRIVTLLKNFSDFTTTGIESITPAGTQEVFDLQIDRTENFIANSLVSHNTRWQEDDLAGVILDNMRNGGDKWDVLSMPAIAEEDDILGREIGEPLAGSWFPKEQLEQQRENLGAYWFSAMYQQQPQPEEGGQFKLEWMDKRWDSNHPENLPIFLKKVQAVDSAFKKGVSNDYSVIATWGWTGREYYLIDLWREKVEFHELKTTIMDQYYKHKPEAILIEDTAAGIVALQEFERESSIPVVKWPVKASKEARADVVSPLFQIRKVWIPTSSEGYKWVHDWVDEHRKFPNGKHDDTVDTTTIALAYLKDNTDERQRAGNFMLLPVGKGRGTKAW